MRNPVVRYMMSNPNRSLKRHEDKRSRSDYLRKLYAEGGASAIFQYANESKWTDWSWCKPCEADTPTDGGECLICGQFKQGETK